MILQIFLLQTAKQNLILGLIPESFGVLLFGIGLIGLTIALRRVFKYVERRGEIEEQHKTLA